MSTTAERDEIMEHARKMAMSRDQSAPQWAQAYATLMMADRVDELMATLHNLPNALQDAIWQATRKR